jgi:hypothetical protein
MTFSQNGLDPRESVTKSQATTPREPHWRWAMILENDPTTAAVVAKFVALDSVAVY